MHDKFIGGLNLNGMRFVGKAVVVGCMETRSRFQAYLKRVNWSGERRIKRKKGSHHFRNVGGFREKLREMLNFTTVKFSLVFRLLQNF